MCGIAGIVAPPGTRLDPEVVRAMARTLVHRGPDAEGVALPRPHVGLGHRRLAILDLSDRAAQPMANADGSVWITFNGEIFNFRELRAALEARGRAFVSRSDTEVLLAQYEAHGVDGLRQLRGQFAFVIVDLRDGRERVVAARDPLGIKPLYWSHGQDGVFRFASEPRAILADPAFDRTVDDHGLHLFLRYRFVPAPRTAWRAMQKLAAGEVLTLEAGRLAVQRTWQLVPHAVETEGDLERARRELAAALPAAVDRQRIADVPVGAFLSGGLDSSTIATLLARLTPQPIATFTVGFEQAAYDERRWAGLVAERIGSRHHAEEMGMGAVADVIPAILRQVDEPFGDPSLVPTWLLSQVTARHAKVAMSGDGGDELFGGYGRTYRALGVLEWPSLLRPFQRALRRVWREGQDPSRWSGDDPRVDAEFVRLLVDVGERDAQRLYGPRLSAFARDRDREHDPVWTAVRRHHGLPPFSRVLAAELDTKLADYHLVKVDRAAMAHGLEVRVPFLDQDLVELAFRWSAPVRLSGGRSKGLLRDVMQDLLPGEVLSRDKKGFGPPLGSWFGQGLGVTARGELLDGEAVRQGFLSRAEVDRMTDPSRGRIKGSRLWRLLVLEHWLRSP